MCLWALNCAVCNLTSKSRYAAVWSITRPVRLSGCDETMSEGGNPAILPTYIGPDFVAVNKSQSTGFPFACTPKSAMWRTKRYSVLGIHVCGGESAQDRIKRVLYSMMSGDCLTCQLSVDCLLVVGNRLLTESYTPHLSSWQENCCLTKSHINETDIVR